MHELRCFGILGCAAAALVSLVACGDTGIQLTAHEPAPFAGSSLLADSGPIAGVNFAVSRRLDDSALDHLQSSGVAWIALIPFGWQSRFDIPEVQLRTTNVRWGETDAGLAEIITRARARGIRTLMKPHIWLRQEVAGQWRGTVGFASETDWQACESDYRTLILHYAALAQLHDVDMFSVGVELHRAVRERPDFWRGLIDDVRAVYDGPLTYGANWDGEFTAIQFWDRPVLFTQVGYRSIAGAAIQPWNFTVRSTVDHQQQADAYEVLFRTFWGRDWFAGVFLWEWDADIRQDADLSGDDDFTPQAKLAEAVVRRWFGAGT